MVLSTTLLIPRMTTRGRTRVRPRVVSRARAAVTEKPLNREIRGPVDLVDLLIDVFPEWHVRARNS